MTRSTRVYVFVCVCMHAHTHTRTVFNTPAFLPPQFLSPSTPLSNFLSSFFCPPFFFSSTWSFKLRNCQEQNPVSLRPPCAHARAWRSPGPFLLMHNACVIKLHKIVVPNYGPQRRQAQCQLQCRLQSTVPTATPAAAPDYSRCHGRCFTVPATVSHHSTGYSAHYSAG